jgi:long-chain acyl-CoA synthetase
MASPDATVYGEKNQLLGSIVCAKVKLQKQERTEELVCRLNSHCKTRLDRYKIPMKITVSDDMQCDERSKKMRRTLAEKAESSDV